LLQAGLVALVCGFPATTIAVSILSDSSTTEGVEANRSEFLAARAALLAGDLAGFDSRVEGLQDYVLHDHLRMERLLHDWRTAKPGKQAIKDLNAFEQTTDNTSLTRRLTRRLQNRLADTQQWSLFLGLGKSRLAAKMPCTRLRARDELGKLDGFDEDAIDLWIKPKKHDERCQDVLVELGYLATRDREPVKAWIKALKNPQKLLKSGALDNDTVLNRRIIANLVVVWSREDTPAAIQHWMKVRDDYAFYADRYYDTHRAIAMRGAYRRLPGASEWLDAIAAKDDDLELMEWRVRTSLLEGDWKEVLRSIERLPAEEQEEDHWAYWVARAHEVAGKQSQADAIYKELAELQSYHGFLSADRLKTSYSIKDEPIAIEDDAMSLLADTKALMRAMKWGKQLFSLLSGSCMIEPYSVREKPNNGVRYPYVSRCYINLK